MQDIFPLKSDNDHFPTSTADISKMLNATSQTPLPAAPQFLMLCSFGSLAIIL